MGFQYSDWSCYRNSDLVVVDKNSTFEITDFTVPGESIIEEEKEKIEKYQDLRKKLQKIGIWQ